MIFSALRRWSKFVFMAYAYDGSSDRVRITRWRYPRCKHLRRTRDSCWNSSPRLPFDVSRRNIGQSANFQYHSVQYYLSSDTAKGAQCSRFLEQSRCVYELQLSRTNVKVCVAKHLVRRNHKVFHEWSAEENELVTYIYSLINILIQCAFYKTWYKKLFTNIQVILGSRITTFSASSRNARVVYL